MIENDPVKDRAIVLGVQTSSRQSNVEYRLEEACALSLALGVDVVYSESVNLREVHVANFLGGGKIDEVTAHIAQTQANLVIVDAALSPIQQRNLERHWNVKVIDRTGLILEIFALRAATAEGRLQVEMARLAYERSRLVRTWTHLERQRGGQGFLAGPGETQIEADRRVLNDKITKLRQELETVRQRRHLQSRKRKRAPERIVALVGYTNAGKSTLFNALTDGNVFAEDMLFATLDTTLRILSLPNGKPAILSDTVGFIADLPTDLISAFQATLEEVKDADLLVHVRDISDPMSDTMRDNVLSVLNQIEAGPEHNQPLIEVWNKIDQLDTDSREAVKAQAEQSDLGSAQLPEVFITSAMTGLGLDALLAGIEGHLSVGDDVLKLKIPPSQYDVRAWVHENGQVLSENSDEVGNCLINVQLSEVDSGKLRTRHADLIVS